MYTDTNDPDYAGVRANGGFVPTDSTFQMLLNAHVAGAIIGRARLVRVIEAGSSSGLANVAAFDTGSAATTLTAPNVPAGTYFVRVRARTAGGTSPPSNEIIVTVRGA